MTLQIFSRYTALIPSYIWTEEMARFLFIWMIMIGAMIGVREGTHFEVDVWPRLGRARDALLRLVGGLGVLALALVFVWAGIEFTRFGWNRISELAELPLWMIHIAWPLTGLTWLRVPRRADVRRPATDPVAARSRHERRQRPDPGTAALDPVRRVLPADVPARAGRLRARPGVPADPVHRAAPGRR